MKRSDIHFNSTHIYLLKENECGTEDVLPIGQKKYFQSPNYPEFYGSDHNCTWCIHVPAEYVVKLEFLEFKVRKTLRNSHDSS